MANSETILTAQVHNGDSSVQTVTGDKYKGDGFYSRSDGLHTVQYNLNQFIGTITIQGTLATSPTDADYFAVATTTQDSTTGSIIENFTGNYVWVRAVVSNWTSGAITSISLNH